MLISAPLQGYSTLSAPPTGNPSPQPQRWQRPANPPAPRFGYINMDLRPIIAGLLGIGALGGAVIGGGMVWWSQHRSQTTQTVQTPHQSREALLGLLNQERLTPEQTTAIQLALQALPEAPKSTPQQELQALLNQGTLSAAEKAAVEEALKALK